MLLSLVCFALRCLLRTLAPSARSDFEREVEVLVLRHQLKALSRGSRRPPFHGEAAANHPTAADAAAPEVRA